MRAFTIGTFVSLPKSASPMKSVDPLAAFMI